MSNTPNESGSDSTHGLSEAISDPETRARLIDIFGIASLLQGCVIDRRYSVPDALAAPIRLSELGQKVFDEVRAAKPKFKPNDIKVALLNCFGCPEGLFVQDKTDVDALRKGLGVEIKKRKIMFPYIFGRDLHDESARLFPGKFELDNDESIDLLRTMPPGVFQEGRTVVGPFGALEGGSPRDLYSQNAFPGYYCSDPTCSIVHWIRLNSANVGSRIAPANRTLMYVLEHVQRKFGNREDPHTRLLREAIAIEHQVFKIGGPEVVFEAIADSLNDGELRAVAEILVRRGLKEKGSKHWSVRLATVITDPRTFVEEISRAHLLQVLLLFSDRDIRQAVDEAVSSGGIEISEHEVRIRKLSRFGHSGVNAEIGGLGVRLTAGGTFVASYLQELLYHVYFQSAELSPADLAYLVGADLDEQPSDLLDRAVREKSPEQVLNELILGSRASHALAMAYLGLDSLPNTDRKTALDTLLWKLGATTRFLPKKLAKLEFHEAELLSAIREAAGQDATRGAISNLFASLENALRTALEFSTWALTNDHFIDDASFVYDPASQPTVLSFIEEYAPTEDPKIKLRDNGQNALVQLGAGFSRLAKALSSVDVADWVRPEEQIPLECRNSGRPFAFPHTLPYLDLSEGSEVQTRVSLQRVSQLIQDDVVLKVRNAPLHGVEDFPSAAEMTLAVEKIAEGRQLLLQSGFFPTSFKIIDGTTDSLGRRVLTYAADQVEIKFFRPAWSVFPGDPLGSKQLVIVPFCGVSSSGPFRFSIKSRPGEEAYWKGWPKRWRTSDPYVRVNPGAHDIDEYGIGDSA